MLTFFKKFLGFKYEIERKPFLRTVALFFNITDFHSEKYITSFHVYKHKKNTIIEIETYYPGILIGKAGRYINEMKEFLKENHPNESIEIHLKECKLWLNVYR